MFVRVLALSLVLIMPRTAEAWTDARVREARAEVELGPNGSAQVELEMLVDVRAGFLLRLDLEGLDEDLTLDPERAAWLVTDFGTQEPIAAHARASAVTLRFDKRAAPRRGLHRIFVRYHVARLARTSEPSGTRQRVRFTLPGWSEGLDRAEIVVRAPVDLSPVSDPDIPRQVDRVEAEDRAALRFVRTHVPRMTPWSVAVSADAALFASAEQAALVRPKSRAEPPRRVLTGLGVALFVCLLGALSRHTFRRRARSLGAETAPWIPRTGLRRGLRVGLFGMATLGFSPALGLSMLALVGLSLSFAERVGASRRPPGLGRFEPVGASERRAFRVARLRAWLGFAPWVDITSLSGALGAFSLVAICVLGGGLDVSSQPWGLGILCALPAWGATSRMRLPRPASAQWAVLLQAVRCSRVTGCALRLLAFHEPGRGPSRPRLRVTPSARHTGLLRVDVAADARSGVDPLVLCAVALRDSLSDRALASHFGREARVVSPGGRRVAYVTSAKDLDEALEGLFEALSQRTERALGEVTAAARAA